MHFNQLATMMLTGTATGIDAETVTSILDLVKNVMGLFTEYPLNVYLTSGLVGLGFAIFGWARHAAH